MVQKKFLNIKAKLNGVKMVIKEQKKMKMKFKIHLK